jgi:hypothetical protein
MDSMVSWVFGLFVIGLIIPLAGMLGCIVLRRPQRQSTRAPIDEDEAVTERPKWTAVQLAAASVAVFLALLCLPLSLGVLVGTGVLRSARRIKIALPRLRPKMADSGAAPAMAAPSDPAPRSRGMVPTA